jgi:translation initiation factor IF-1
MIGHPRRRDLVACDGTVAAALAASFFRVRLADGRLVVCRPCGKMQLNRINVAVGDFVIVEAASCDLSRGRITCRYHGDKPVVRPRRRRTGRGGKARPEFAEHYGDVA